MKKKMSDAFSSVSSQRGNSNSIAQQRRGNRTFNITNQLYGHRKAGGKKNKHWMSESEPATNGKWSSAAARKTSGKMPCQFYLSGYCQFNDDKDCAFSHDREVCFPGALKEPCCHFMGGYCRNGNFCLNLHDRSLRDAAQAESKARKNAPRVHTPKIQVHGPLQKPLTVRKQGEGSSKASEHPKLEKLEKKPWKPVPTEKQQVQPDEQDVKDQKLQEQQEEHVPISQAEYHAALRQQEHEMYYFGQMPDAQEEARYQEMQYEQQQQQLAWAELREREADEAAQAHFELYGEHVQEENMAHYGQQYYEQFQPGGYVPMCKFFKNGSCRYGDRCQYSHAMEKFDQEKSEMDLFEKSASEDLECGICLEVVMKNGDGRFGILTGCDHAFCLKCIKNWRSSDMSQKESSKQLVRKCPLCREPSFFVIPCDRLMRDPARKQALVAEYQSAMKNIHCRYFDRGRGECPFGTSCFYSHQYLDGREQDPGELRTFKDAEGRVRVDGNNKLSAFLDFSS